MDILSTIFGVIWVNGLQLSHLKCVRALIRAMLETLSINLARLAQASFPQAKTASTIRRIERLLAMRLLNLTLLGKAIVRALPPQKKYILTMDRTTWELGKRTYNILAIGICFDGISVPIYFTAYNKRGATNSAEQSVFMEHVLEIIPANGIKCLVADREFGNVRFIRWLRMKQIPYCLRLRESYRVRSASAGKKDKGRKLKSILSSLAVGQSVVLADSYIVCAKLKVRIYAVRRTSRGGEGSLLILATPAESDFTDVIYRLRWQIETAFRAMKTSGFNMEDTHLPIDRFQNMLALVMIAYACAFIEGLITAQSHPIPLMKSNGRKRYSIFTWGLSIIISLLWKEPRNCSSGDGSAPS